MKTILLCGGYATRLYPLTLNQPKPLLPIGGRPMLEWILDKVREIQEMEEAILVTNGFFYEHFEKWARKVKYPWPIEIVNDRTTSNAMRLGAIGDLYLVCAEKHIEEEDLLVVAGDNLFDFDLRQFVAAARTKGPHASLAVYDIKDRERVKQYGVVRVAKNGKVLEFCEKPETPPSTLVSCCIYWLPGEIRVLLDRYLSEGHNPDQPGYYMRWLAETDSLFAIPLKGCWLDIGDRTSYDQANRLFRKFHQSSQEEKT